MTGRERAVLKVEKVNDIRMEERRRCLDAIRSIWTDRPDASSQYSVGFGEALAAACATIRVMD